jgi:hypothetical protein
MSCLRNFSSYYYYADGRCTGRTAEALHAR